MKTFLSIFLTLVSCSAISTTSVIAQDVAAATAPAGVTMGPRLLIVQKTLVGQRWRSFDLATNAWQPWEYLQLAGAHLNGYDRVAIAGCNDQGIARYNAFESVLMPDGSLAVADTGWNFSNNPPLGQPSPHRVPTTVVGSFFFPADAVGRARGRGFMVYGTSAAAGLNGTVFGPREMFRANPVLFRDMATARDSTPEASLSAYSTTLRDASEFDFDRTTAVMHQHVSGSRTVALYSSSDNIVAANLDTRVDLGSPVGVMTQAPLLFIHDSVAEGPMNLFTVARDATGRRRLFERTSPLNQTQLASWSGWKDWGFPANPPTADVDDLEMNVTLVWREPVTNRLRVNMFGTRGGRLVERHWGGSAWAWGTLRSLPAPGTRITDGAVLTRGTSFPRLSVFAVTPAGAPYEFVYDGTQGEWRWEPLN